MLIITDDDDDDDDAKFILVYPLNTGDMQTHSSFIIGQLDVISYLSIISCYNGTRTHD